MIDVEMWFLWCKGVVFGMVLSVIIKEFGEWVRRRRTQRAADVCLLGGKHEWNTMSNGEYTKVVCGKCGKRR